MSENVVNSISGRLSLRRHLRESLEILARITEIALPAKKRICWKRLRQLQANTLLTDFE
jgi:hypothetical protein